jgi:protein-S-isoprenylcysteine O-methyltransferase Ste14
MDQSSVERGAHVRFPPPLVFLGAILFGVACEYVVVPAPVPVGRAISATGGLLVLVTGLGLIASARIRFTRTGQDPMPWTPSPALILSGPYRFIRNPMYLGVTLVEIGIGLAANNLWIALLAFPALLAVHFIAVLPEEKYLSEKFGESYQAYRARVGRYLPFAAARRSP